MSLWIQPNVVRPADLPSDHPDEVHDWRGWPKFHPRTTRIRSVQSCRVCWPRFMQPAPSFRLTNLVDDLQYTAWLSFTDAIGGTCVGQYAHPDSPNPGSSWNGRVLSFSQLKLFPYDGFSSTAPPDGRQVHSVRPFKAGPELFGEAINKTHGVAA
ncbi:hypothetical protein HPB49_020715 [Dermacentor silvarum]|uniref:Uncharacterized protein n=1 Tax=Dermacentor silvarum TaxID=543639 RepID=A0ACB8CZS9_DERSI|nr:hypothetical protein HPB49_020715 [Dermacentor silvarum]